MKQPSCRGSGPRKLERAAPEDAKTATVADISSTQYGPGRTARREPPPGAGTRSARQSDTEGAMASASLTYRALGAAVLDRGTYEGIEHDRSATVQAVGIVLASSLAAGIGASGWNRPDAIVLLVVSIVALVTWLAWVLIVFHLGGRYFAETQTDVTFGELLRTIGFAASPGLLQVFAVIPELTEP